MSRHNYRESTMDKALGSSTTIILFRVSTTRCSTYDRRVRKNVNDQRDLWIFSCGPYKAVTTLEDMKKRIRHGTNKS